MHATLQHFQFKFLHSNITFPFKLVTIPGDHWQLDRAQHTLFGCPWLVVVVFKFLHNTQQFTNFQELISVTADSLLEPSKLLGGVLSWQLLFQFLYKTHSNSIFFQILLTLLSLLMAALSLANFWWVSLGSVSCYFKFLYIHITFTKTLTALQKTGIYIILW